VEVPHCGRGETNTSFLQPKKTLRGSSLKSDPSLLCERTEGFTQKKTLKKRERFLRRNNFEAEWPAQARRARSQRKAFGRRPSAGPGGRPKGQEASLEKASSPTPNDVLDDARGGGWGKGELLKAARHPSKGSRRDEGVMLEQGVGFGKEAGANPIPASNLRGRQRRAGRSHRSVNRRVDAEWGGKTATLAAHRERVRTGEKRELEAKIASSSRLKSREKNYTTDAPATRVYKKKGKREEVRIVGGSAERRERRDETAKNLRVSVLNEAGKKNALPRLSGLKRREIQKKMRLTSHKAAERIGNKGEVEKRPTVKGESSKKPKHGRIE